MSDYSTTWANFLGFPKKVTTYGKPDDAFERIVDTYRREGDKIIIDRKVTLREPLKYIILSIP